MLYIGNSLRLFISHELTKNIAVQQLEVMIQIYLYDSKYLSNK
jgi:hypothetical protein